MFKYLLKIAYPVLRIYWFTFRPKVYGVRCILVSPDNKVLMIQNTYRKLGWDFPGGGIKKGESEEEAVKREIEEEVGVRVSEPKNIGKFENRIEYKEDTVTCFVANVENKDSKFDPNEIEKVEWFDINNLPKSISPLVVQTLELWKR